MKKKAKQLGLTLCMLFFTVFAMAQQKTVTGKVIDQSGNPLPNVSYVIKGTQTGGMTDEEGSFSIQVPGSNSVLVFSEVNHQSQEVRVGTESDLTVVMSSVTGSLDEVVVTALGVKRDKRSLGYAVQQVRAEDVTLAAPTDVAQGLMGKVAGLNISTSNGLSNASSRIVIRGNNSLTGMNQPLIVVDGAIIENSQVAQGLSASTSTETFSDWGNYLSYLNMDNIENVSVLLTRLHNTDIFSIFAYGKIGFKEIK